MTGPMAGYDWLNVLHVKLYTVCERGVMLHKVSLSPV